jgi:glycosyltransferase involved in cell wall biosynthesis
MASSHLPKRKIVVAIPVKNEAARIGDCLDALARQQGSLDLQLLLLLNNCTDETAAVANDWTSHSRLRVHIREITLPPCRANAGQARALTMRHAAELAGPEGVLLTTDADGRVYPDWVAASLAALERGCDAVAGRAEIDPVEAALIPATLHEDDARECAYGAMLDEIDALLDPDSADPWPRHNEHSGASIAVTIKAYRRAGGIPAVSLGEDRAFFDALRRTDARIRHAPEVRVIVSGRTEGRAIGGMADTIRRRMKQSDAMIDDRLEPAFNATRRAWLRKQMRRAWMGVRGSCDAPLAEALRLGPTELSALMRTRYFGAAWAAIEKASPLLAKQRVAVADLANQAERAASILRMLHGQRRLTPVSTNPADIEALGDAPAG